MIPLNCAIVFGCIYKVVELFVHKRERLYTALRIGWLLTGIGFGFLLGFCINMLATYGDYSFRADEEFMFRYREYVSGIVYVACVCICGGIGLLMSYRAERKAEQPKEKKDEFEV